VVLSHYEEFIAQRSGDEASQAELALVQDKVKGILPKGFVKHEGSSKSQYVHNGKVHPKVHNKSDQVTHAGNLTHQPLARRMASSVWGTPTYY